MRRFLGLAVAAGALTAGTAIGAVPVPASAAGSLEFVSPTGSSKGADTSCTTAKFNNITTAIAALPVGGTVHVCKGTYKTSVTVDKRMSLLAVAGATINAVGQEYGIGIAAPRVTVSGFTVEHADSKATNSPNDGIITAGFINGAPVVGNNAVIVNNTTIDNLGAGIDVNSAQYAVVTHNKSMGNGVGINLSNDLGTPSAHNVIAGNNASDNPGGCGIALADHTGVGVFDNLVTGNVAIDNGLGTPSRPNASSGSGVILASATAKGGVYDNVIQSNQLYGNGHAGVVLHAHVPGPNFSGNQVIKNTIGTNNTRTDVGDTSTTGLYFGDTSPVSIHVANNLIRSNTIGVFTAGPVTLTGAGSNVFVNVTTKFKSIPTYGS